MQAILTDAPAFPPAHVASAAVFLASGDPGTARIVAERMLRTLSFDAVFTDDWRDAWLLSAEAALALDASEWANRRRSGAGSTARTNQVRKLSVTYTCHSLLC